jgi:hypothetical protein
VFVKKLNLDVHGNSKLKIKKKEAREENTKLLVKVTHVRKLNIIYYNNNTTLIIVEFFFFNDF